MPSGRTGIYVMAGVGLLYPRLMKPNVAHHPPQIALNNQQKPFNGRCALGLLCERPAGKQMSASIAEFLPKSI